MSEDRYISKIIIVALVSLSVLTIFPSTSKAVISQSTCDGSGQESCTVPKGQSCPSGYYDPLKGTGESTLVTCITTGPVQSSVGNAVSGFTIGVLQDFLLWILNNIVLSFVSFITGLSAVVLNGAIYYTIINVKNGYAGLTTITTSWKVVRDIANMGFIFVLLYAAIKTIIGLGGDNKKLIVNIVVAAILMNFSLFITKVVIDIGNVLALTFYHAMAPHATDISADWSQQAGLSNQFMQFIKLQSLYNVPANITTNGSIMAVIMGSIMMLIAAFVFFAAALMFIIRYIVLVLVLILSPLMFVSMVLPDGTGIGKYRKMWTDTLLGQTFFAPIYFLLTWVSLQLLAGFSTSLNVHQSLSALANANYAGGATIPASAFDVLINFILVITLLITSLMVAKEWASKGGTGIGKLINSATGIAGKASFGLAGFAGRNTIGFGAETFKGTRAYKKLEAISPNSRLARWSLAATDKARTTSFDVRATKIAGGIAGSAGINAGKAQQGGFEAEKKSVKEFFERPGTESFKKRQERSRRAEEELKITDEKLHESVEEFNRLSKEDDVLKTQEDRLNAEEREIRAAIASGTATTAQRLRLPDIAAEKARISPERARISAEKSKHEPNISIIEKAIATASGKEVEAILESNRKLLENQTIANKLSVQQLEAINKSDKFTESEKDKLKKARFSPLQTYNDAAGLAALAVDAKLRTESQIKDAKRVEDARKAIKGLSDSELEMIEPELIKNKEFINQLRQPQVDTILKSSKFTQTQKDTIKAARREPLLDAIDAGDAAKIASIIKKTDPKVLAGYMSATGRRGMNIAVEPEVIKAYTPQILRRMASGDNMTSEDIGKLRAEILKVRDPGGIVGPAGGHHPTDDVVNWLWNRQNGKGMDVFNA